MKTVKPWSYEMIEASMLLAAIEVKHHQTNIELD